MYFRDIRIVAPDVKCLLVIMRATRWVTYGESAIDRSQVESRWTETSITQARLSVGSDVRSPKLDFTHEADALLLLHCRDIEEHDRLVAKQKKA